MYSEIVRAPRFFLDDKGMFFPEATTFIMTGREIEYLYHLFHTKTLTFFFKRFYAGGGLGEDGYRYKKAFFEKLPIPIPSSNISIDERNAEILCIKLYGLTKEECAFIEHQ